MGSYALALPRAFAHREDVVPASTGDAVYFNVGPLFVRYPARGAVALKALTSPGNEGSQAFHRSLGFTLTRVEDYGGAGQARMVMRKPLRNLRRR